MFLVRSIPSCHAKREDSCHRDAMVFATYLPGLMIRFASTLKSNHNYNLSIMNNLTSSAVTSPEPQSRDVNALMGRRLGTKSYVYVHSCVHNLHCQLAFHYLARQGIHLNCQHESHELATNDRLLQPIRESDTNVKIDRQRIS